VTADVGSIQKAPSTPYLSLNRDSQSPLIVALVRNLKRKISQCERSLFNGSMSVDSATDAIAQMGREI
jgi:hypothetical protein